MTTEPVQKMTYDEWLTEGRRRFGNKMSAWQFKCPVCKHVQSPKDFKEAGAPHNAIGFSCIGRWIDGAQQAFKNSEWSKGPCDYAGGGLFRLNPVHVKRDGKTHEVFEFAEPTEPTPTDS